MTYRLFIFDFDGTLADSFTWFCRALNDASEHFAYRHLSEHDIDSLRGCDNRAILKQLKVSPWRIPAIARHLGQRMAEDAEQIPLFPQTRDLIATLSTNGLTIALVSSNREGTIRRILGPDTTAHIAHFACGASLFGKAAKFRRVIKLSGIPAAEAIAIGDEMRDIEAATAAGIHSGAVTWGYAHAAFLEACAPTLVFRNMDDICALVSRSPQRP